MFRNESGARYTELISPWKEENVKRVVKGSYTALTKSVVNSDRTSDKVMGILIGNIKKEIKEICSNAHNSILLDDHEAVKKFSWKTIWTELNQKLPTLMKLLTGIVDKSSEKQPVLCLIASMILKARYSRMALVQRAISLLLYGNGASKQVHNFILV